MWVRARLSRKVSAFSRRSSASPRSSDSRSESAGGGPAPPTPAETPTRTANTSLLRIIDTLLSNAGPRFDDPIPRHSSPSHSDLPELGAHGELRAGLGLNLLRGRAGCHLLQDEPLVANLDDRQVRHDQVNALTTRQGIAAALDNSRVPILRDVLHRHHDPPSSVHEIHRAADAP